MEIKDLGIATGDRREVYEEGDRCTNPKCRGFLTEDFILMVTTSHLRGFCSVECLKQSHDLHTAELLTAS